ncbi:hypothetical protein SAY86_029406 [Trapa natans]|uniref:tetraacyldisaccharide 4'-kinase n=1 Tax=Trapa natans TaxID=22666 RepID=A0AAN7MGW4_TRANT|nr:hypothetical protein SAY86_029406 [Trapa natans]
MERLRRAVAEIAYAKEHTELSLLHRSLVPLLSFASSLYRLALSVRSYLYGFGLLSQKRLPVPVISVGNLTWGGNGKTPTVEFLAGLLADSGIPPLILTRGYAGGDEARMLQRHLLEKSVRIGVGANRAGTAASFIEKYGCFEPHSNVCCKNASPGQRFRSHSQTQGIGAIILDDGMQHWPLWRDLDIVMINALQPWGNGELLPLGPLREPLKALQRADIAVIHNADLVHENIVKSIELSIREIKDSIPTFFTRMAPAYFFEAGNIASRIPLEALSRNTVLCVSAIGSATAFVKMVEKLGAIYVDRVDFSDHHIFQREDIDLIKEKLTKLEGQFGLKPIIVITEKDYDRDPEVLKHLDPYKVWAVCAQLQFVPHGGCSEDQLKNLLANLLRTRNRTIWFNL